jgi:hypothetical protein
VFAFVSINKMGDLFMKTSAMSWSLGLSLLSSLICALPSLGADCVNLSGTWKGTCQVNGANSPMTLTVKQEGCASVETYDEAAGSSEFYVMGGIRTLKQTYPNGDETVNTLEPKWAPGGKSFTIKSQDNNILTSEDGQRQTTQLTAMSTYSLAGNILSISMAEDGATIGSCKLQK